MAIEAWGLTLRYGTVQALDGLDLAADRGTVLGLLGPNGAGKTTVVRILSTLIRPDAGRAAVLGWDVVQERERVRSLIGLSGQYAAVDGNLTGRENLEIIGQLSRLGRRPARARAGELIDRLDLGPAGDRLVRTYSGGMRRRLDLAAALVASPPVLILDEPTTGLDPRARSALWSLIVQLVDDGTAVLLTTQYLEEADRLADRLAIVDHGRVVAAGTPADLKARVGGDRLEVLLADPAEAASAWRVVSGPDPGRAPTGEVGRVEADDRGRVEADQVRGLLTLPAPRGTRSVTDALRALERAGVAVAEVALRRPTLDEAFLALTGHPGSGAADGEGAASGAQAPR